MINWMIGGLLALAVFFAVRYLWKQHKLGQCAGGCAGCHGCGRPDEAEIEQITAAVKSEAAAAAKEKEPAGDCARCGAK